jgi:hypothetical protein
MKGLGQVGRLEQRGDGTADSPRSNDTVVHPLCYRPSASFRVASNELPHVPDGCKREDGCKGEKE